MSRKYFVHIKGFLQYYKVINEVLVRVTYVQKLPHIVLVMLCYCLYFEVHVLCIAGTSS